MLKSNFDGLHMVVVDTWCTVSPQDMKKICWPGVMGLLFFCLVKIQKLKEYSWSIKYFYLTFYCCLQLMLSMSLMSMKSGSCTFSEVNCWLICGHYISTSKHYKYYLWSVREDYSLSIGFLSVPFFYLILIFYNHCWSHSGQLHLMPASQGFNSKRIFNTSPFSLDSIHFALLWNVFATEERQLHQHQKQETI